MEKLKVKPAVMPESRPPYYEWLKQFKVGSQGKPLMEALGRADTTGNPNLMNGYDFSKLKR